jgi:phosphinothricin acetyltransferase
MSGTIRLARESDGDALAAIYRPVVAATPASFELVPPDGAEMARRIRDTLPAYPWLVCEVDGRVAGYAYGMRHRARPAYRWSAEVSVYIDAAHRRGGIGRGLYTSLFAILGAQGYCTAFAGITLPNPGSVALHEALGFEPIGVFRRIGHKFGQWHDVGWWQRPLREYGAEPTEPVPVTTLSEHPEWEDLLARGRPPIRPRGGPGS